MSVSPHSQHRLIEAAMRGDHEAFRMLTEPWLRELGGRCARILGNQHDAEDAVQETLIKAWRKLDSYSAKGSLRAWLHTIATNTSLNLLKVRQRNEVSRDAWATPELVGPGLDESFAARENVESVFMTVVSALPARQRAVIVLGDGLGLSAIEIAELLSASLASVNSALQRARAALVTPPADPHGPRLDDLQRALLSAYVAAWDQTDIDRLVSLARSDAARTTLIQRLKPVGAGWVRLPDALEAGLGELTFRPAFMNH